MHVHGFSCVILPGTEKFSLGILHMYRRSCCSFLYFWKPIPYPMVGTTEDTTKQLPNSHNLFPDSVLANLRLLTQFASTSLLNFVEIKNYRICTCVFYFKIFKTNNNVKHVNLEIQIHQFWLNIETLGMLCVKFKE